MSESKVLDSLQDHRLVYEILGNLPEAWIQKANDLLVASQLLFNHYQDALQRFSANPEELSSEIRFDTVAWMLRAMAIECLLKSVWLTRGEKLAIDGRYAKIPNTSDHELNSVAREALAELAIVIDERDEDLLRRLSLSIVDGRYPIQKNADPSTMALRQKKGEMPSFNKSWSAQDHELFEKLLSKIRTAMGEG